MNRNAAELSVVIPTYNEKDNLEELVSRVARALAGRNWEIIFVDDDSPDGTADRLRELARAEPRVRCIKRIDRRGLSSACVEGMLSSSAQWVAVMDADLQHDPALLPRMQDILAAEPVDLVIGSRYMQGGGIGAWDTRRAALSRFATRLANLVLKREVSDPMSGYFMIRRTVFEAHAKNLSSLGFKILFDIIATIPRGVLRIREVPYVFGTRWTGESKLQAGVIAEFAMLVLEKKLGKLVPVRFLAFASVGAIGVGIHFAILTFLITFLALDFMIAQATATLGAMVFNFSVNNRLTYADQPLTGGRWLRGLSTFLLTCSVGALANVGIASHLFDKQVSWQLAALLGVLLSVVWNYAVTSRYTWGVK